MALSGLHQLCIFIRVETSRVSEVMDLLAEYKIKPQQMSTVPYSDGEKSQVLFIFSCSKTDQPEICKELQERGIGEYGSGSDVNVFPLALVKNIRRSDEDEEEQPSQGKDGHPDEVKDDKSEKSVTGEGSMQTLFQSTIKARIAVENILELVQEGASFSFDFFLLVLIASSLSLIGLMTNSSVTLVASMLVSPMMGPILGFTFGTVVRDGALIKTGLRTEAIALFLCIFVGYVGGLAAAPAAMRQTPWPTYEMSSRGTRSSLYVGAAIAIPSGIGVALSIMGQNTNSLVGVAISASLLPPCVNCGLLWAMATLDSYYFKPTCLSDGNTRTTWQDCCMDRIPTASCPANVDYPEFCCTNVYYSAAGYGDLGSVSFALTLVNIACIWTFGALTFWLKEVAPLPNKSELWTTVIPKARMFNAAVWRGEIKENALQEELVRQRKKKEGRYHKGGHKLVRDKPINRRDVDKVGQANGVIFPTNKITLNRGRSGEIFAKLRSLYNDEDDSDDDKDPRNNVLLV